MFHRTTSSEEIQRWISKMDFKELFHFQLLSKNEIRVPIRETM